MTRLRTRVAARPVPALRAGAIAVLFLLLATCSRLTETKLEIQITEQPIGGWWLTEVDCTMKGQLVGTFPQPKTATIEWWWENRAHENQRVLQSDTHTFRSASPEFYTTSYVSRSGGPLNCFFWVRVSWTDDDGTPQLVESSKAEFSW